MRCIICGNVMSDLNCKCGFSFRGKKVISLSKLPDSILQSVSDTWYEFSNRQRFFGTMIDGKMVGEGRYLFPDGSHYKGYFYNNKFNGFGTFEWASHARYEGTYKDGKRHGHGKMTYANGEVYDGEWKEDKYFGHGEKRYANGDVYDGEWKEDKNTDGKRHGQGEMHYANGDVYNGEWKEGERCGHGIMQYANGDVYEGEWKKGKRCGHGKMSFANDNVYEGEWKDDKHCGHGTMRYANGDVYDGEWIEDKRCGHGVMHYSNGAVYDGEWKADKWYGQVVLVYPDGTKYVGEWEANCANGRGRVQYTDGSAYDGEFYDGEYNGQGTLYRSDGRYYIGQFKKGKPIAQGKEYDSKGELLYEATIDGEVWEVEYVIGVHYRGKMNNGFREGYGTTIFADGTMETGIYQRDSLTESKQESKKTSVTPNNERASVSESSSSMNDAPKTASRTRRPRVYPTDDGREAQAIRRGFSSDIPSFMRKTERRDDQASEKAPVTHMDTAESNESLGKPVQSKTKPKQSARRTGPMILRDGSKYVGEICNNVPDGEGFVRDKKTGKVYKTTWDKGKLIGSKPTDGEDNPSSTNSHLEWLNDIGI